MRTFAYFALSLVLTTFAGCALQPNASDPVEAENSEIALNNAAHEKYPYLFHLIQADLWKAAIDENGTYYPPTYVQDGFTHATANPEMLLTVANHFYTDVHGDWLCLRMTVESLAAAGTETVFEGTAPVGDKEADFNGSQGELFPHILGGISPDAVIEVHPVSRSDAGQFVSVGGITDQVSPSIPGEQK